MTKRFAGLTPAQLRVFEQIATGNGAGHNQRTLDALVSKGFVEKEQTPGGNYRGTTIFWITRYFVPLPVHIAWCQWCAEQADDIIDANAATHTGADI